MMRTNSCRWILLFALCICGAAAHAQTYPAKPVRVLVGFSPGGSVDLVARLVAAKLTESLGQQFVVENRAGATGNIAAQLVTKAPPDGYTLLLSSTTALASGASIFKKLPFDPQRDFAPIALVVHQPYVLVVHPSLPTANLKQFIAFVKARPGQLNYGSSGLGGGQHLSAEMFMMVTGTRLEQVPYKGGAPALVDLLAGRVGIMFETVPTVIDHIKNGKLRALAVTSLNGLPSSGSMREAVRPKSSLRSYARKSRSTRSSSKPPGWNRCRCGARLRLGPRRPTNRRKPMVSLRNLLSFWSRVGRVSPTRR